MEDNLTRKEYDRSVDWYWAFKMDSAKNYGTGAVLFGFSSVCILNMLLLW